MRIPMKGGLEYDALTKFRRLIKWRPGEKKRAKKSYARRLRRMARGLARDEGE